MTDLALAVGPEVDGHGDHVVDGGVGGLVEQGGAEGGEGQDDEAGLDGAVQGGAGQQAQRPLPGEHEDAEQQVDDLQHRHRLHRAVEVLGQEVEEDLGPEEALDGGAHLICWRVWSAGVWPVSVAGETGE